MNNPEKRAYNQALSISKATWGELRSCFGPRLYPLIVASIIWTGIISWAGLTFNHTIDGGLIAVVALVPWAIGSTVYAYFKSKATETLWRTFAQNNGFTYTPEGPVYDRKPLLFKIGHSRHAFHIVKGLHGNVPVKIFGYNYSTGSGKNKTDFVYTVFEFSFRGHFPHIYLNHHGDPHDSNAGELLSLPPALEKRYELRGPRKYEIEVLELFDYDTLEFLITDGPHHDVELVGSSMYIFLHSTINSLAELEKEYAKMKRFADHLAPKLHRASFAAIGDMPHKLKDHTRLRDYLWGPKSLLKRVLRMYGED